MKVGARWRGSRKSEEFIDIQLTKLEDESLGTSNVESKTEMVGCNCAESSSAERTDGGSVMADG